jgi:drug/metabolite transporter (DMT)-like permease
MQDWRLGPVTAPHLGFLFLCFLWGSTWIAIRIGAVDSGPVTVIVLRLALATAAFVPVVWVLGRKLPAGRPEWRATFIMGVLLYAGNFGPVYWGEAEVPAGLGAVLFATMPLQVTLLAHLFLKDEPLSARRVVGILVGLLGVYLLVQGVPGISPPSFTLEQVLATDPLRVLAIFLGATGAALSTVLLRRETARPDPVGMNLVANGLGALVLLPFLPLDGPGARMPSGPEPWLALIYLVIVGSLAGFLVFYWLVRVWPANRVALVNLVTPITAVSLGIVLLGEGFDPGMVLGGGVILAGVALAVTAPSGAPAQGSSPAAAAHGHLRDTLMHPDNIVPHASQPALSQVRPRAGGVQVGAHRGAGPAVRTDRGGEAGDPRVRAEALRGSREKRSRRGREVREGWGRAAASRRMEDEGGAAGEDSEVEGEAGGAG